MTSAIETPAPKMRLWLAVLAGYLAFGATLQALPAWVDERFGAGAVASGLAVGIAFAATALCRPFAGRAGDARRARPVVLAGGVLIAVGALGQLVAPDLPVLLVARVIMGAGEAALFSGALPWVLAQTPAERRGRVAGWFGLSMWGGLAAGPLVTVAIGQFASTRSVWFAVIALGLLSALLAATAPAQRGRPTTRIRPSGWRDIVPRGASLPGLGFGLSAFGYGTVVAILVLYLGQSGLGGTGAGLTVFAGAFLAARAVGSPAVDRYGGTRVALVMAGIELAGFVVLAAVPNLVAALVGAALVGVGVSLMFPATVATTLRRTGDVGPGTSVGATTSFWDIGIAVAGPLSGVVAAGTDYRVAFAVAALTAGAAGIVAATLHRARAVSTTPIYFSGALSATRR